MQKLTNMEAQRVINCLEDSLTRLKILSSIPAGNPDPDLLSLIESTSQSKEVKSSIESLWQLEDNYLVARAQTSSSHHNHHHHRHHHHHHHHHHTISAELIQQLHQNVRTVCRHFKRDPTLLETIQDNYFLSNSTKSGENSDLSMAPVPQTNTYQQQQSNANMFSTGSSSLKGYARTGSGQVESNQKNSNQLDADGMNLFYTAVTELTGVTFRKLATTVEEEQASKALMHELVERERGAEDERNALAATLALQREERTKEATAIGDLYSKLSTELKAIAEQNQRAKKSIAVSSKSARASALSSHDTQLDKLTAQFNKLELELKTNSEKHTDVESTLRKKKEKREHDLAAKIKEYDEVMFAKKKEIEELKLVMANEKSELDTLEEHFAKIDANNMQRDEEEKVLSDFKKRVSHAKTVLADAAAMVQKLYRGNATRAQLKAEKGKKKKGKKKG